MDECLYVRANLSRDVSASPAQNLQKHRESETQFPFEIADTCFRASQASFVSSGFFHPAFRLETFSKPFFAASQNSFPDRFRLFILEAYFSLIFLQFWVSQTSVFRGED